MMFKNSKPHEYTLNCILDSICGRGPGINLGQFIKVNEQSEEQPSLTHLSDVITVVKAFVLRVTSRQLTDEQILQELKNLELSSENADILVNVLKSRRDEVNKSMVKTVSQISASYLQDFDWKLHLVVASDKCTNFREPILLLNLYVKKENQDKADEVLVELNKSELDDLLSHFEKIQQVTKKLLVNK
ncbi:COMM domain-containing protein [Acrasis kona]|uniref:COMM domain-containing protein n=1 Tax=Acrasis kona TaxID=1008807 RepID=A0AAW2Z9Q5_9EUKA